MGEAAGLALCFLHYYYYSSLLSLVTIIVLNISKVFMMMSTLSGYGVQDNILPSSPSSSTLLTSKRMLSLQIDIIYMLYVLICSLL